MGMINSMRERGFKDGDIRLCLDGFVPDKFNFYIDNVINFNSFYFTVGRVFSCSDKPGKIAAVVIRISTGIRTVFLASQLP